MLLFFVSIDDKFFMDAFTLSERKSEQFLWFLPPYYMNNT